MSTITDNDKYVLNAIFNPNYPLDFDKESSSTSTNTENERQCLLNNYMFVEFYSF